MVVGGTRGWSGERECTPGDASDLDDMDLKPIEKKKLLRALGL